MDVNGAELTRIHVVPGVTGKGVGTLLMRRSLDYIREQNFSRVVLGVIAANTGARRFYEFHGPVLVEELPDGVEGVPVAIYELGLTCPVCWHRRRRGHRQHWPTLTRSLQLVHVGMLRLDQLNFDTPYSPPDDRLNRNSQSFDQHGIAGRWHFS